MECFLRSELGGSADLFFGGRGVERIEARWVGGLEREHVQDSLYQGGHFPVDRGRVRARFGGTVVSAESAALVSARSSNSGQSGGCSVYPSTSISSRPAELPANVRAYGPPRRRSTAVPLLLRMFQVRSLSPADLGGELTSRFQTGARQSVTRRSFVDLLALWGILGEGGADHCYSAVPQLRQARCGSRGVVPAAARSLTAHVVLTQENPTFVTSQTLPLALEKKKGAPHVLTSCSGVGPLYGVPNARDLRGGLNPTASPPTLPRTSNPSLTRHSKSSKRSVPLSTACGPKFLRSKGSSYWRSGKSRRRAGGGILLGSKIPSPPCFICPRRRGRARTSTSNQGSSGAVRGVGMGRRSG